MLQHWQRAVAVSQDRVEGYLIVPKVVLDQAWQEDRKSLWPHKNMVEVASMRWQQAASEGCYGAEWSYGCTTTGQAMCTPASRRPVYSGRVASRATQERAHCIGNGMLPQLGTPLQRTRKKAHASVMSVYAAPRPGTRRPAAIVLA